MKTADLAGAQLDYYVAKAKNLNPVIVDGVCFVPAGFDDEYHPSHGWVSRFEPSKNWSLGGPMIGSLEGVEYWKGEVSCYIGARFFTHCGRDLLEACMRCIVASVYGDEVPDISPALLPRTS